MRFGIVEGEPGIFPDPIARVFRAVTRLFRRKERRPTDHDERAQGGTEESEGDRN